MTLDNTNKDIIKLRNLANNQQWFPCEEQTKRLLRQISPQDAIRIALKFMSYHLDIFEHYHPDVSWPRKCLDNWKLSKPEEREYDWPIYGGGYTSPGTNGYLNAMGDLRHALRSEHNSGKIWVNLVGNAIVAPINTSALGRWIIQHSYNWNVMGVDQSRILAKDDPETQKYKRDTWLEVANEIEKALGKKDQSTLNNKENPAWFKLD